MKLLKKFPYLLIAIVALVAWYEYMQLFVQDSKNTATSGIVFQKTLELDQYKLVANGNSILGNYARYSRSDRHNEVLTIYCKSFCKK